MASPTTTLSAEAKGVVQRKIQALMEMHDFFGALDLSKQIADQKLARAAAEMQIAEYVRLGWYEHATCTAEKLGDCDLANTLRQEEINHVNSSFLRRRNPELLLRASIVSEELGQHDKALEFLEKAAKRQFSKGKYISAARNFKKLGKDQMAEQAYERALSKGFKLYSYDKKNKVFAELAEEFGDFENATLFYQKTVGCPERAFSAALKSRNSELIMSTLPHYIRNELSWVDSVRIYAETVEKVRQSGNEAIVNKIYEHALKSLEEEGDYAGAAHFAGLLGQDSKARAYIELVNSGLAGALATA